ncbi:MAG TPA: hypothetical protein VH598_09165, partial [Verrucomicrobiae bacterium]|nr:hypothetical protein [Verrucomicrobiae bacterium]
MNFPANVLFQWRRRFRLVAGGPGVRANFLPLVFLILLCGCMRREPRADLVIVNGAEPETVDPGIVLGQPDMR